MSNITEEKLLVLRCYKCQNCEHQESDIEAFIFNLKTGKFEYNYEDDK